jgi:hypothetical protein
MLALPPPAPPREPRATFCTKLVGNGAVKKVEGTVAGQLVILIENAFGTAEIFRFGLRDTKRETIAPRYPEEIPA